MPKLKQHVKNKPNPFEVHINKQKMEVLGRKLKNDRGLPGVSRGKALKKRKETLLNEYKVRNKSNQFKDRRIGETNHTLSSEDKLMARFTAIKRKAHKKSIFNLADDEVLTHKGQSIAEIEKFDDPRSEDEYSDDGRTGNLEKNFVEDAHFGGGILRKTGKEGARTHKELIDELIAESKKRKLEKQKTKEATLDLTEKLDMEWKDLLPLVNTKQRKKEEEEMPRGVDNYDKLMRELKFEARGTVSDRLKTEEETEKEDMEKLKRLEEERLERMKDTEEVNRESNKYGKHRSADDLDDVVYDYDPEYTLSYNEEGVANVEVEAEINGKKVTSRSNEEDEDADDEEVEDDNEEDEDDDETGSESDDLSDLKADSSSESEHENEPETEPAINDHVETPSSNLNLPDVFPIPRLYEELKSVMEHESYPNQAAILQHIIQRNDPSLAETNKEQLATLFVYLLQYLHDFPSFSLLSALSLPLYNLAQINPESTAFAMKEVLKEKHEQYRKHSKQYPKTDELLVLFKVVSLLFSTSDFRHSVVSPCLVFMEQLLVNSRVKTQRDLIYGLLLVTLVLEFTALSKRFLPACIIFLGGVLHMAVPKCGVKLVPVKPPFTATNNILVLSDDCSGRKKVEPQLSLSLLNDPNQEDFKLTTVLVTLRLIENFHNNLAELPSVVEIFCDILGYIELLDTKFYPKDINAQIEKVKELLQSSISNRSLVYIKMTARKPKALRLYEPKFEPVFDVKRRGRMQSREKAERSKLMHKLKRETKGALREIRRDGTFLGRVKIQQRIKSDHERKEKVKRIYAEAAVQQGELNSMDRKNKKITKKKHSDK